MRTFIRKNIFTLLLIGFFIFILAVIPLQIKVSLTSKSSISPQTFPYFASIVGLICCGLSLLIELIHAASDKFKEEELIKDSNISYLRSAVCAILLFIWYLVLPKIGFIISTILITMILSYMLGNRKKILLIAFPVIFTFAIYFVFSQLLHVALPEILF